MTRQVYEYPDTATFENVVTQVLDILIPHFRRTVTGALSAEIAPGDFLPVAFQPAFVQVCKDEFIDIRNCSDRVRDEILICIWRTRKHRFASVPRQNRADPVRT